MTQTPLPCPSCRAPLADAHPSGNLIARPGVHVRAFLRDGYAILRCPACSKAARTRAPVVVSWWQDEGEDEERGTIA